MNVPRPRRKILTATKRATKKLFQRIANRDSASTKAAIKARKRVPPDCQDIPF